MAGPNNAPPPPPPPQPGTWERFSGSVMNAAQPVIGAAQNAYRVGLEGAHQAADQVRYAGHAVEDYGHLGVYVFAERRALQYGARERGAEEIIADVEQAGRVAVMASVEMSAVEHREAGAARAARTAKGNAGDLLATPGTRLVEPGEPPVLPRGGERGHIFPHVRLIPTTNVGRIRRENLAEVERVMYSGSAIVNEGAGRGHHPHGHRPLWVRIVEQVNIPIPDQYNPPTHYHHHPAIHRPLEIQSREEALAVALYATTADRTAYAKGAAMDRAGKGRRWNHRHVNQVHDIHHIHHEALHTAEHEMPAATPDQHSAHRYLQARDHFREQEEQLVSEVDWLAAVTGDRELNSAGEQRARDRRDASIIEVDNYHLGLRADLQARGYNPDLADYVQGIDRDRAGNPIAFPTEHYDRLREVNEYLQRARDRRDRLFSIPMVDPRSRDLSYGDFDALYPDPQQTDLYDSTRNAQHFPPAPGSYRPIPDPDPGRQRGLSPEQQNAFQGRADGLTPAQEEQRDFLDDLIQNLDNERIMLNGGPGYDDLDEFERDEIQRLRDQIVAHDAHRREADIMLGTVEPTDREIIRHSEALIDRARSLNKVTAYRLSLEAEMDAPVITDTIHVSGREYHLHVSPSDYINIVMNGPRNEGEREYFNNRFSENIPDGGLTAEQHRLQMQIVSPDLPWNVQRSHVGKMVAAEALFSEVGVAPNFMDNLLAAEQYWPDSDETHRLQADLTRRLQVALTPTVPGNPLTRPYTGTSEIGDLGKAVREHARIYREAKNWIGFENSTEARNFYQNVADKDVAEYFGRPPTTARDIGAYTTARDDRQRRQAQIRHDLADIDSDVRMVREMGSHRATPGSLITGEEAAILRTPLRGHHRLKRRYERGVRVLPQMRARRRGVDVTHYLGEGRTQERIRQARARRPIYQRQERRLQGRARNAYGDFHVSPIVTRDTRRTYNGHRSNAIPR